MARPSILSRDKVLSAAVAIVDREGLDALSMRRLGEELGVEAMSLYRYVANKAALLDGVVEAILSEMSVRDALDAPWTDRVKARSRALRATLRAHPNALSLFATRPAVTPASMAHVEASLALLREAGFSVADAIRAFQAVVGFTIGNTLSVFAPLAPDERSSPAYGSLDPASYPTVLEAAKVLAKWKADDEFEFGLDALVRGLVAKLDERPAKKRPRDVP
ncbi:MAG: TetR/AcrR family transcriptional regulator C-terminal domain-containing protein [Myxococcales bacterium]|nr:TetR/AcrR family transcriptional regulator C-terminal domain-containing protein [Myxococcales bacterium]